MSKGFWNRTVDGSGFEVMHHANVFRQGIGYQVRERERVKKTKKGSSVTRNETRSGTRNETEKNAYQNAADSRDAGRALPTYLPTSSYEATTEELEKPTEVSDTTTDAARIDERWSGGCPPCSVPGCKEKLLNPQTRAVRRCPRHSKTEDEVA